MLTCGTSTTADLLNVVNTNEKLLHAYLIAQGYSGDFGFFETGFTYLQAGDLGFATDGTAYKYVGANPLPVAVPAGTDPTASSDFEVVAFNDHGELANRNAIGAHDDIYARSFNTLSELLNSEYEYLEGKKVNIGAYHNVAVVNNGGGDFVVTTGRHDGGTFIDPNREFPTDWTDQTQLDAWFLDSGEDVTGIKRQTENFITPEMFGAKGDRVSNDYRPIKKAHQNSIKTIEYDSTAKYLINPDLGSPSNGISILDGHDIRFNFCWIDCTQNTHECYSLYYFDTRQTGNARFRRFKASNVNLASSLGFPSEGSVTSPQYRHFLYIDGGWWQGVDVQGVFTPEGGTGLACRSAIMCDMRSLNGDEPGVPDESTFKNINLHYGWSTSAAVVFLGDDLTYGLSRCDTVELDNILVASAPFIYDYNSFGTTNTRDGRFGAVILDNARFGVGPIGRVFDKYCALNATTTGEFNNTQIKWAKTEVKEVRGTSRAGTIKGKFTNCRFNHVGQWIDIFNNDLTGAGGARLMDVEANDCTFDLLEMAGRNPNDQTAADLSNIPDDWVTFRAGVSARNIVKTPFWAGRDDDYFNASDVMQTKISIDKGSNTVLSRMPDITGRFDSGLLNDTTTDLFSISWEDMEYRDIYRAKIRVSSANDVTATIRVSFSSGNFDIPVALSSNRLAIVDLEVYQNNSVSKGSNPLADSSDIRVFAVVTDANGVADYVDGSGYTSNNLDPITIQGVHPATGSRFLGEVSVDRGGF